MITHVRATGIRYDELLSCAESDDATLVSCMQQLALSTELRV